MHDDQLKQDFQPQCLWQIVTLPRARACVSMRLCNASCCNSSASRSTSASNISAQVSMSARANERAQRRNDRSSEFHSDIAAHAPLRKRSTSCGLRGWAGCVAGRPRSLSVARGRGGAAFMSWWPSVKRRRFDSRLRDHTYSRRSVTSFGKADSQRKHAPSQRVSFSLTMTTRFRCHGLGLH